MNPKNWASFFIFIVSTQYIGIALASSSIHKRYAPIVPPPSYPIRPPGMPGNPPGMPGFPPSMPGNPPGMPGFPPSMPGNPPSMPGNPPGRPTSCIPGPKMVEMFDNCFDRVKQQLPSTVRIPDSTAGGFALADGQVSGLQNFRRTDLSCMCMPGGAVKVFIELSFIDITVTFLVTLLDGVLGGLLGNLGTTLARLVGQIVNLVVGLVSLEINVVIEVEQKMEPGAKCQMTDYRVTRISGIKLLDIDLTQLLVNLLGDILTPVVEALLKNLLNNQVQAIIKAEIEKLSITKDMFMCV